MLYRADLFDAQVPDGWRDDTVHRFLSPDAEEQITIQVEQHATDLPVEQRLLEKTRTVREGVPGAALMWEGDAVVGSERAKAFRLEGIRGDEVPLTYFAILARWGERRLIVIDWEGPTARFAKAGPAMLALAASMHRRTP